MIRFALALLGLSAGAANAQGLVPLAPGIETCGLHLEVQTESHNNTEACGGSDSDQVAGENGSAPIVPPIAIDDVVVPTRAIAQRATVPADPTGAKTPSEFIQIIFRTMPECVGPAEIARAQPITADRVYSVAMDGSNPSAMFCP